jgi:hypothetical protein
VNRQTGFTLAAVAAAILSTLAAGVPIWRMLSKFGGETWRAANDLLHSHTWPCLAASLVFIIVAILLRERRPLIAVALLIAAPFAAIALDLGLALHG